MPRNSRTLFGITASPGFGLGPACLLHTTAPNASAHSPFTSAEAEQQRLAAAIEAAAQELTQIVADLRKNGQSESADIFDAHRTIVNDPELRKMVEQLISSERKSADEAWNQMIEQFAGMYAISRSEMLREKAHDVRDAGGRVTTYLRRDSTETDRSTPAAGHTLEQTSAADAGRASLPYSGILIARELTPSQILQLDATRVKAVVCATGSATSHNAILLRNRRIPAVFGVDITDITESTSLAVVATSLQSRVIVHPSDHDESEISAEKERWQHQQIRVKSEVHKSLLAPNGEPITVWANIGGPEDVALALDSGAQGVGLYRTEFLFMARNEPPCEDEQTEAYAAVLRAMNPRPVVIRTTDIGADKPVPWLGITPEANPFLGWRGIRHSLDQPDFFRAQLRALLRASFEGNLHIMFPMVTTLDEWRRARAMVHQVRDELMASDVPVAATIPLGIMVEVPAVALQIDEFLAEVDFISIGTNDLVQYLLAADRTNPRVEKLADYTHPAVDTLLRSIITAALRHGKSVSMCGEMAGDPAVTNQLLTHGLRTFSMNPDAIANFRKHYLEDLV
jgi:phosphoenolpyruvate-protein phosphotransferase